MTQWVPSFGTYFKFGRRFAACLRTFQMALAGRIFAAESLLEGTMVRRFLKLAVPALAMSLLVGCATQGPVSGQTPSLVGAWLVTSARGSGVGKNMLTFSSDGTFFRSGDTHPVLSGGHGAWRQVSPTEFEATYIAFRFDGNRKWVGSTKTRLHIKLGESPNEFTGTASAVNRDLEDKPVGGGKAKLEGKRIVVEGQ